MSANLRPCCRRGEAVQKGHDEGALALTTAGEAISRARLVRLTSLQARDRDRPALKSARDRAASRGRELGCVARI